MRGGAFWGGSGLKLYIALGISKGDIVAFAGAGGKSHAIIQAAGELAEAGTRVLVAPTTKMFVSEAEQIGPVLISEDRDELRSKVAEILDSESTVVVGRTLLSKNRLGGVETYWVPDLTPDGAVALVEADGSRRLPVKGTAPHEPLLPEKVTLVVAVGGVQALGKPLNDEYVHRPEVFSKLTGVDLDHTIHARAFARALLASFHNTPDNTRRAALLTHVKPGQSMSDASAIARQLWYGDLPRVVLSSLPEETPGHVWVL